MKTVKQTKAYLPVSVVWMVRAVLPDVLEIEAASSDDPWLEEDFLRFLRGRDCIGNVALADNKVAGFMLYELNNGFFRIVRLAVHPNYRRCGVGTQLVEKLKGKLTAPHRWRITADVSESNLGGQLFFKFCGLRATHIIRESGGRGTEDVFLMQHCVT